MPEFCEGIEDMRGAGEPEMDEHAVPTFLIPLTMTQLGEIYPEWKWS